MTTNDLRAALDAPIATEEFDLAPGLTLTIRGVVSYGRMQSLHKEAEGLRTLQAAKPLTCGGDRVQVDEDTCNAAVMRVYSGGLLAGWRIACSVLGRCLKAP